MIQTKRKHPKRYQATGKEPWLNVNNWLGLNLFDEHSATLPGQFKSVLNVDLYAGFFKSRKGSSNLNSTSSTLASEPVLEGVVWDVGEKEYALIQCDTGSVSKMRYVELSSTGAFRDVLFKGTISSATLASDAPATMFISGGKCYVFHVDGNHIIEYLPDTDSFEMRTMGMQFPTISSLVQVPGGNKTGKYAYAIELVYQEDGVDLIGSSPNRLLASGAIAFITLDTEDADITIDSSTLPTGGGAGDFWTHVRLYKSGNLNSDTSDIANTIPPETTEYELYPVKLVDRASLISASYVITDDVPHDEIDRSEVWSLDPLGGASRVELLPLPAGKVGCFHKDRIWVGRCPTEDPLETTLYYSNFAGTAYGEQYDPLQRVPVEPGDGQKLIKVMPFEDNLVVLKDGKTGYIPSGNPDIPFSILDHSQGIKHKRLCAYVPNVGICAITTDNSDLKILTANLQWINIYGSQEISRLVRPLTKELSASPTYVSFTFVNGKLKIWDGETSCTVLHVDQAKGWTQYEYPISTSGSELVLTFAGNSREVIISSESYLVETELDINTDLDTTTGLPNKISVSWDLHRFQNNQGRDLLEFRNLSVSGSFDVALTAQAHINGQSYPSVDTPTPTDFIPDPSMYDANPELKEGIYELYLRKRPIAPYQHFTFSTTAPCTIRSINWVGWITTDVPNHIFNRFLAQKNSTQFPKWVVSADKTYDAGSAERILADYLIIDAMDEDGDARDIRDFILIGRD